MIDDRNIDRRRFLKNVLGATAGAVGLSQVSCRKHEHGAQGNESTRATTKDGHYAHDNKSTSPKEDKPDNQIYVATVDELLKNGEFYDGKMVATCGQSLLHVGTGQGGEKGPEHDGSQYFTHLDIGDPNAFSFEHHICCLFDTHKYTQQSMDAITALHDANPEKRVSNVMVVGRLYKGLTTPSIDLEALITPSGRYQLERLK